MSRPDAAKRWARERAQIAARVGGGERADELLGDMPYSSIPEWADVARVLDTIDRFQGDDMIADLAD